MEMTVTKNFCSKFCTFLARKRLDPRLQKLQPKNEHSDADPPPQQPTRSLSTSSNSGSITQMYRRQPEAQPSSSNEV